MEYVSGRSVRDIIAQGGAMSSEIATRIVLQVARGLAYAHAHGVVHRDIKPENILVDRDNVAELTDFGLARQMDAELTALTRTGASMGTPYYMAPEQGLDAKHADARCDIYALGATWYHMVTGRRPFEGDSVWEVFQKHQSEPLRSAHKVHPGVPRSVSTLISRMMAKEPDQRVQTAEELCELIESTCFGQDDGAAAETGDEERDMQWEMMIVVGGTRVENRRLDLDQVREAVRGGTVTPETPTRLVGEGGDYVPARLFPVLVDELPDPTGLDEGSAFDMANSDTQVEVRPAAEKPSGQEPEPASEPAAGAPAPDAERQPRWLFVGACVLAVIVVALVALMLL